MCSHPEWISAGKYDWCSECFITRYGPVHARLLEEERNELNGVAEEQAYILIDYMTAILEASRHVLGKCDCGVDPRGQVGCAVLIKKALQPFVETGPAPEFHFGLRPFPGAKSAERVARTIVDQVISRSKR